MKIQIIKNEEEYQAALSLVEKLIDIDPAPDSQDGRTLETWAVIIGKYEDEICPEEDMLNECVDPIAAIKFRMEQMGLKNKDLKGLIGSVSKVSEVLSYNRPLNLKMIRTLSKGLSIPIEILAQEPDIDEEPTQDYSKYPIRALANRGYFGSDIPKGSLNDVAEDHFLAFLHNNQLQATLPHAHYRRNISQAPGLDEFALTAWRLCVLAKAKKIKVDNKYEKDILTDQFMSQLIQLSFMDKGPELAIEYLRKSGIRVVIEEHFPKTRLDGAVTLLNDYEPVIGLTLRFDRIDYFWFTLFHEIAHIKLHLGQTGANGDSWYIDDLSIKDNGQIEEQADLQAGLWLLPEDEYQASPASSSHLTKDVRALAKKLRISAAIIAGRIRNDTGNYRKLSNLVGQGKLRNLLLKPDC